MKFRKYPSIALLCGIATVFSCSKPKDEQVPIISSVTTGGMQHGIELHALAGAINYFDITASDNESLKIVRCRLYSEADFHTHTMIEGATNPAFKAPNTGVWEVEKSVELEGTEMNEVIKFSAPENLSGRWEIEIGVMDQEGNIGYYTNGVIVQNDSMPAIFPTASMPLPDLEGIIHLNPNQPLVVEGNIVDGNYIQQVEVTLSRGDEVISNQIITPENTWLFALSQLEIIAPGTTGTYTLRISAKDFSNWTSEVFATLEIK